MLKKHKKIIGLWIFMLLIGCSHHHPICVKEGRQFCVSDGNFTYREYDYYERALSCMEGGCYQYALNDLDKAVSKRPYDKRKAKTYGIHLKDYFPHREKGLVYFLTGNYDLAQKELELSLSHERSEKALLYLDKVRRHLLEQDAKTASVPHITIKNPADNELWTRDMPVMISGIAEDPQYVSEIISAGKPVLLERSGNESDQRIEFKDSLILNEGTHNITITARNLMDTTSSYPLTIHVDRTGPVIVLESIESDMLQGYVYDESGEIFLNINGRKIDIPKGKEAAFSFSPEPDTQHITLIAGDKLGNETKADLTPRPPSLKGQGEKSGICCKNSPLRFGEGQGEGFFAELVSDMKPSAKTESPEIFTDDMPDGKTVFSEILSVKGQIKSRNKLESVFINDTRISDKGGLFVSFNHPIPLNLGENHIRIRTTDSAGKESNRNFFVIREIPEPLKLRYRCMVIPQPFQMYSYDPVGSGDIDAAKSEFQHLLSDKLMAGSRFQISSEQSAISSVMRLLLSGVIHKTKDGIELSTRITDMQTSEVLGNPDAYRENGMPVETMFSELAEKIHKVFPLVRGKITHKNGEKMFAAADGDIKMKWLLVIGSDTRFAGHARIDEKITGGNYRIKFINSGQSAIGDWVITQ